MLLAVEGGGFFSSSASGYTKGLSLLLLRPKTNDKPMRISPWDQYRLVDEEPHPQLQLASIKNRLSTRCASFICFGSASSEVDRSSPLKIENVQEQGNLQGRLDPEKDFKHSKGTDNAVQARVEVVKELDTAAGCGKASALKSSLKKPSDEVITPVKGPSERFTAHNADSSLPSNRERRKVQWTDTCGRELAQVKEFEPSEMGGSDDEFDNGAKSCSCTIM